ncbi:MAG: hypothetical protein D6675_14855 [Gemmatimonadetes bacterium]|nr:MAG: hypothetical protein D6675_14855 [Gemmatimonadota bacterium]
MIQIVCALHCEAKPLIELLELKKDHTSAKFDLFQSNDVQLIISGVGKLRSAIATTFLIQRTSETRRTVLFNIGVCGSAHPGDSIGQLFLVHKVTDHATQRSYFSDLLLEHPVEEAPLETFDQPVTGEAPTTDLHLVDMEAAGFFEAASIFLAPNQIYVLKIVSDHLECLKFDKQFVTGLVANQLDAIRAILFAQKAALPHPTDEVLTEADYRLIYGLRQNLRLTETQLHQVVLQAKAYKIRFQQELDVLHPFTTRTIHHKSERRAILEEIRERLGAV